MRILWSTIDCKVLCKAILLGFLGLSPVHAQSSDPVSFALEKTAITSGEPVLLHAGAKNMASQALEVDFGLNGQDNVLISVTDPAGIRRQKPEPVQRDGMAFFGWKHLEKGQDFFETLVLNEWFDFTKAGKYEIEIRLKQPPTLGKQPLHSNPTFLTVEVTPYDREKLALACKDLVSRIHKRETADAADRALSYVQDPVVVPYWDQVLEDAALTAISSLYKIGNREAVHVLGRALKLQDKLARSQARQALQALARDSNDPALKSQIADELRNR